MPDDSSAHPKRTIAPLFTWRSAISESCLKPVERHCLLALSLYMNERGGSAFPGSTRLAHDTGYHVDTVKRALSAASSHGWLRIVVKGGAPAGQPRRATEYVARIPELETDRWSWTTGGPESADRRSSPARPGVQGLPITSMNSPKNSAEILAEKNEERKRKDREAAEEAAQAPWVRMGVSREVWTNLERENAR